MNELPELLESKRIGAFIGNNYYGCPMQADDVALITLTRSDLNKMIDLRYQYSCKWRYTLNPSKSVVLVFGESLSRHNRLRKNRHWKLGEDPVSENTEHRHVGILLSTTLKNTEKISLACPKTRYYFFALVGSGLKPGTTSPLRVYSDRTRQRHNDGVRHNALELEHMFVNRSIQTGCVASKILYNRDAVVLTLARPV